MPDTDELARQTARQVQGVIAEWEQILVGVSREKKLTEITERSQGGNELLKLISATGLKLERQVLLVSYEGNRNNSNHLDFVCELESFLMHARSVTNFAQFQAEKQKRAI